MDGDKNMLTPFRQRANTLSPRVLRKTRAAAVAADGVSKASSHERLPNVGRANGAVKTNVTNHTPALLPKRSVSHQGHTNNSNNVTENNANTPMRRRAATYSSGDLAKLKPALNGCRALPSIHVTGPQPEDERDRRGVPVPARGALKKSASEDHQETLSTSPDFSTNTLIEYCIEKISPELERRVKREPIPHGSNAFELVRCEIMTHSNENNEPITQEIIENSIRQATKVAWAEKKSKSLSISDNLCGISRECRSAPSSPRVRRHVHWSADVH